MNWEQLFCPNYLCGTESWLVRPLSRSQELWSIAADTDDTSYTVAASDPICPHCGETLCAAVELPRRTAHILEAGPMLDYVRSLR